MSGHIGISNFRSMRKFGWIITKVQTLTEKVAIMKRVSPVSIQLGYF